MGFRPIVSQTFNPLVAISTPTGRIKWALGKSMLSAMERVPSGRIAVLATVQVFYLTDSFRPEAVRLFSFGISAQSKILHNVISRR